MFIAPPAAIEAYPPPAPANAFRDFAAELGLTLGNPKVIVFFVALLPVVVGLNRLTLDAGLVLGGAMAVVLSLGNGAVMAGAAVVIAAR